MTFQYSKFYEITYGKVTDDFGSISRGLSMAPSGAVADIGAGTGRLVPVLCEDRDNVVLVESDPGMLSILKDKFSSDPRVKIVSSPSYSLPLENDSLAAVIFAYAGLCEMHPIFFSLSEAHRVLRAGGVLQFSSLNPITFRTGARGLSRASLLGCQYSVSAETIPVPTFGEYEHQVHFEVRQKGVISKSIIEQVYPPKESWLAILSNLGFEVISIEDGFSAKEFDESKSLIMNITAVKKSATSNSNEQKVSSLEYLYDDVAPKYSKVVECADYMVFDWVNEKIDKYKGYNPIVLDLGCANGGLSEVLSSCGVEPSFLFGADISRKMIGYARETNKYTAASKWDLSAGFPEPKSMVFDLVTALGVCEFVADISPLLNDVARILKLGGEALITLEAQKGDSETTTLTLASGDVTRYFWTEDRAKALFVSSGLEVVEIKRSEAYTSPSTGSRVSYLFCHLKRGTVS